MPNYHNIILSLANLIIVPCHRVIGVSGKLTGFAGGLEAKAFLLRMESPAIQTGFWDKN